MTMTPFPQGQGPGKVSARYRVRDRDPTTNLLGIFFRPQKAKRGRGTLAEGRSDVRRECLLPLTRGRVYATIPRAAAVR